MRSNLFAVLGAIALLFTAGACSSVPPETVELSHTIGRDLEEIHRSHRALAELHFNSSKQSINAFIDLTYRPAFIEMTAEQSNLQANISTILQQDPGRLVPYMSHFLVSVDRHVESKRQELLTPVIEQERQLLADIDAAHSQVQAANSVVSGHLASIRSVHDAQSQALSMVGIEDLRERIANTTANLSDRVAALNTRGAEINASLDTAAEKVQELDEAIDNAFNR